MDNLSDDILVEIWSRVPCKVAVRCKSISKRFLSFISQANFIERFIDHHHTLLQQMKEEDHEKQYYFNFVSRGIFLILFLPTIHLSNLQTQNQLYLGPQFDPYDVTKEDPPSTRILGCSNGLLLCKKSEQDRIYYVCNPITKDYVHLPPLPPFTGQNRRDRVLEGFLCEPYYRVEGDRVKVNVNRASPRFRVVRIPCFDGTANDFLYGVTKYEFEVVVFSSETGQWSTKIVSCPSGFTQTNVWVPAVAHKGRLYFMGKTSLLVYDPFSNDGKSDTVDYPVMSYQRNVPLRCHVGVCCGNIRICGVSIVESVVPNVSFSACVCVWDLKEESGWRLVHKTYIPRQEMGNCVRPELGPVQAVELLGRGVQVRAFHPYHGDVVFFQYVHRIFVGNLKTNQFDTVGYGIHGFQSLQTISLDLPCWPTPLPFIP
ncbi:uncharacterized protein LOC113874709 [Abrus precatorius]|uniref:Uncharacterized protein LOC113874709 n=1 Tax=Abrus precatorius TaxID=3816 RepID=A0A8B8MJG1_ABRPR|nr:uncharacterized protein LOC113874709 [Abrus precatorius]